VFERDIPEYEVFDKRISIMERLYLRLKHVIFEVFSLRMVWV
jgi:hypothetical protein